MSRNSVAVYDAALAREHAQTEVREYHVAFAHQNTLHGMRHPQLFARFFFPPSVRARSYYARTAVAR